MLSVLLRVQHTRENYIQCFNQHLTYIYTACSFFNRPSFHGLDTQKHSTDLFNRTRMQSIIYIYNCDIYINENRGGMGVHFSDVRSTFKGDKSLNYLQNPSVI